MAQNTLFQIIPTTEVVNHHALIGIVLESVDSEIPTFQCYFRLEIWISLHFEASVARARFAFCSWDGEIVFCPLGPKFDDCE